MVLLQDQLVGQDALHKGIELEWNTKFTPKLDFGGIFL